MEQIEKMGITWRGGLTQKKGVEEIYHTSHGKTATTARPPMSAASPNMIVDWSGVAPVMTPPSLATTLSLRLSLSVSFYIDNI